MGGLHGATAHEAAEPSGRSARVVIGLLVVAALAVLAGAVVLWPTGPRPAVPTAFTSQGAPTTSVSGRVTRIATGACGGPGDTAGALDGSTSAPDPDLGTTGSYVCARTTVAITGGPDAGHTTTLEISDGPGVPDLHVGDEIRLARSVDSGGAPLYDFADFSRGLPLGLLAGLFALVVVVVARWRGLAALAGLVITFAILLVFAVPALAIGENPVAVAIVASAAVLFAVVFLAHGVSLRTASALLGTLLALAVTAGLAYVAVHGTHLTGLQNEQNTAVQSYDPKVDIPGILLAGFIIGSLGVLNDVTVSQAATVFELAALDPAAGPRRWATGALRVGRDHIASAVYTLALAYAGSALPILLLFDLAGRSVRDIVTGDPGRRRAGALAGRGRRAGSRRAPHDSHRGCARKITRFTG